MSIEEKYNINQFQFSVELKKYLNKKGIKFIQVANILDIPYRTFLSKLNRDSFSYFEIKYLEFYFQDLNYFCNLGDYFRLLSKNLGEKHGQ